MNATPAAPTGVRAKLIGAKVLLECNPASLATRYRFRRKVVGVDDTYKLVSSSLTPVAMLEGIGAGLTVEFIAQAVNGGSQSVASESIIVTMPIAPAVEGKSRHEGHEGHEAQSEVTSARAAGGGRDEW
jgi:hypothetical protein